MDNVQSSLVREYTYPHFFVLNSELIIGHLIMVYNSSLNFNVQNKK